MIRRSTLVAAGVAVMVALAAIPASARNHSSASTGTKTYKSAKCAAKVKQYDFASWACATIIAPTQVNAGDTANVTYMFKAKTKLRFVYVCFSRINSAKCAYKHKYVTINRGATIKRVLKLTVPMVSQTGTYVMGNYTRFYKPPKYADREAYWAARAFPCIVLDGDSSGCSAGGK